MAAIENQSLAFKKPSKRGGARPGAGRPKGSKNVVTQQLKEAILEATERAGSMVRAEAIAEEIRERYKGADEAVIQRAIDAAMKKAPKGNVLDYLTMLAMREPRTFGALLGRIIPLQVEGNPESPLTVVHQIITSLDGQTRRLPSETIPAEYAVIAAE